MLFFSYGTHFIVKNKTIITKAMQAGIKNVVVTKILLNDSIFSSVNTIEIPTKAPRINSQYIPFSFEKLPHLTHLAVNHALGFLP